jgi:hypothetical protein
MSVVLQLRSGAVNVAAMGADDGDENAREKRLRCGRRSRVVGISTLAVVEIE